ncbi:Transcriptional regulator OS=Streptomyces microflavus OX=1919 GN=Smic_42980 PE=4 SV=1 [Streptomyces microflavus]
MRRRYGWSTATPAWRGASSAYLLRESERDNVIVKVVPFAAGGLPGDGKLDRQYVYGPVPQLDTVLSDTATGPAFLDAETRLANYRAAMDRVEGLSLDPRKSRDFIREVAQQV